MSGLVPGGLSELEIEAEDENDWDSDFIFFIEHHKTGGMSFCVIPSKINEIILGRILQ